MSWDGCVIEVTKKDGRVIRIGSSPPNMTFRPGVHDEVLVDVEQTDGTFNLSRAAEILRRVYLPAVERQLNDQTLLLDYLRGAARVTWDVEGNSFQVPLQVR